MKHETLNIDQKAGNAKHATLLFHKTVKNFFIVFLLSTFYFLLSTTIAHAAATVFLSPTAASFSVGKTFSVSVKINTAGAAINAAEGKISFDPQRLSVASLSKAGTIFTLWTDEPSFSANEGTIQFGGGIPNPGFTGSSGTIITVTFLAKAPGDTTVSFISGSVLANDGKGTNILGTLGGANYSLTPESVIPRVVAPIEVAAGTPSAPNVVSSTHPDPDLWYAKSTAEFEWSVPSSITAIRLLFGQISTAIPTVNYAPPINKKTIEDIEDGIWYFHARFSNAQGFGQAAHFPIKVDTTPPKQFQVVVENGGDPTNPSPFLKLNSVDETSGIAQYEIKIDDTEPFVVSQDEVRRGVYALSPQGPGAHELIVKAIDRAGNFTPAAARVTIEAIPQPTITEYPKRLSQWNQLVVRGVGTPGNKVIVLVKKTGSEDVAASYVAAVAASDRKIPIDELGNFEYSYAGNLERGVFSIYAVEEDSRGARSYATEPVYTTVAPPLFLSFGKVAIDYLTTMITLIILTFAFAFAVFYGWYHVTEWKKRLRKEVYEVEASVTNAFRALYEDIQEQFETLEGVSSKRELTKEEKKILEHIKENIKIAEKFIEKEVKDVEKEVE